MTEIVDQPPPHQGRLEVLPLAQTHFKVALTNQTKKGWATYGRPLETWNGRRSFVDLIQELADAVVYAEKLNLEYGDLEGENAWMAQLLSSILPLLRPLCGACKGDQKCLICVRIIQAEGILQERNERLHLDSPDQ